MGVEEKLHTAIISDLHLTEGQWEIHRHKMWKKYKSKEYFFDEDFAQFLIEIQDRSKGGSLELILNGDIFDFDSVSQVPKHPMYRISWIERRYGLNAEVEKSLFKMECIHKDHELWFSSLSKFVKAGHRAIFTIGNHDLELHYKEVQNFIRSLLALDAEESERVQFNEWYYISGGDTLVEHGNQYDPYCVVEDPLRPLILHANAIKINIPFGNLTTRYMINGMGFINPYSEANYIMSATAYLKFFFKQLLWIQPLIMLTWFFGACLVLYTSYNHRLAPSLKDPLGVEDKVANVARKSQSTPEVVRELKELFVSQASSQPWLILKELWLDRMFIFLIVFLISLEVCLLVDQFLDITLFWVLIPMVLFLPFFVFYSRSVTSKVEVFKEPQEKILRLQSLVSGMRRIVYGHTHTPRHENIGPVEHLNSGTWSPSFTNMECSEVITKKTFVWIAPAYSGEERVARLYTFEPGKWRAWP